MFVQIASYALFAAFFECPALPRHLDRQLTRHFEKDGKQPGTIFDGSGVREVPKSIGCARLSRDFLLGFSGRGAWGTTATRRKRRQTSVWCGLVEVTTANSEADFAADVCWTREMQRDDAIYGQSVPVRSSAAEITSLLSSRLNRSQQSPSGSHYNVQEHL